MEGLCEVLLGANSIETEVNGMNLNVTISETGRGDQDYLQILSDDLRSVNVVLITDHITVNDSRPVTKTKKK